MSTGSTKAASTDIPKRVRLLQYHIVPFPNNKLTLKVNAPPFENAVGSVIILSAKLPGFESKKIQRIGVLGVIVDINRTTKKNEWLWAIELINRVNVSEIKKLDNYWLEARWDIKLEEEMDEENWNDEDIQEAVTTILCSALGLCALFHQLVEARKLYTRQQVGNTFKPILELMHRLDKSNIGMFMDRICLILNTPYIADPLELQRLLETTSHLERISLLVEALEPALYILDQQVQEYNDAQAFESEPVASTVGKRSVSSRLDKAESEILKRFEEVRDKIPQDARKKIEEELKRFSKTASNSIEYHRLSEWLVYVVGLPWGIKTEETSDFSVVQQVLNSGLCGLKEQKEYLYRFFVKKRLNPDARAPILLFVGPPGTGKTALGRMAAKALGRKYISISVGGIRDESEIRGFERTYANSRAGRIIDAIRSVGSMNPVIVIDEVDKLHAGGSGGDPAAALLEVLDPEQNSYFTDHYVDLPFDLSQVLFICTGNFEQDVYEPLLNRMDVVRFLSYTDEEKISIARQHLIPKKVFEHGLSSQQLKSGGLEPITIVFSDKALLKIIEEHTGDSGIRDLERCVDKVIGVIAQEIVRDGSSRTPNHPKGIWRITKRNVDRFLRKKARPVELYEILAGEVLKPGCVPYLAVTPTNRGIIGFVEVSKDTSVRGRHIKVRGKLGEALQESAHKAFDFIVHEPDRIFEVPSDIYIAFNLTDGQTPKDGPSAGVSMLCGLYGSLSDQSIKLGLAISGEITKKLGKITAVGGIAEKIIAGFRAGFTEFILPKANIADEIDIPADVRSGITIHWVEDMLEALAIAFPADSELKERLLSSQSSA